ncbi:MAG: hypothetical protein AMS21_07230 [Gemmatimonas sp. SG8_38_2]|nr:MAG: hypothetical protein AMS21_07230 [Gemmatimonas sp. SG8_38_2]
MKRRYYQLVASLPALPDFRRTRVLPLSRLRLEERLALLHPDDLEELTRAERLVSWRRQPVGRTTGQIVAMYDEVMASTENRELRNVVDFRMNMRTVMVALRLKRQGKSAPRGLWGTGPFTRFVESRWADPEFGLGAVFPWIPEAKVFLDQGDAMELEKLLMGQSWKKLSRISDAHPFGFEQVFAFAYKWDILHRWLSYDAEKARERFEELILEVTSDHQNLFA